MLTTIITILVVIVVFVILFKIFRWLMRLILIVVFLGLAWVTNPDATDHCTAVEKKYPGTHSAIKHCNVNDYYVFGLTEWTNGETRVIGAGAFTQVIIFRSPT
jgi:hypothetical protein